MRTSVLETIKPRYIVNEQGKKVEVVLAVKIYHQLLEELEDFYLGKTAEAILKKDHGRHSLDTIKREFLSPKTKRK